MVLILVLDLTFDAKKNDEARFENLQKCLEKQKSIYKQCRECKKEAKEMSIGVDRDYFIICKVREI